MARIRIYTNSAGATLLNIFGYVFALSGILIFLNESVVGGIVMILCGIGLMFLAIAINERAQFRTWKRQIQEKGLIDRIRNEVWFAVSIYNTNPGKQSLAFITELNPAAGKLIQKTIHTKKEQQ